MAAFKQTTIMAIGGLVVVIMLFWGTPCNQKGPHTPPIELESATITWVASDAIFIVTACRDELRELGLQRVLVRQEVSDPKNTDDLLSAIVDPRDGLEIGDRVRLHTVQYLANNVLYMSGSGHSSDHFLVATKVR